MNLLRRTTDQIKSMLAQLTFSQQMLMVCLLVIVIVSVVWLMNYSGESDQVPVVDQQLEDAEQGRLISALRSSGIEHTVTDGKVMVSPIDRERALAVVAHQDALPRDFSFGFEQVVNDSNIWRSESERERLWHVAVENELANVLRHFPNVTDAKVIVDRPKRRGFGAAAAEPTAAVHLRMRGGEQINKKLVTAVADWVSGAVRGLPRDRVKIIDSTNGRSYHAGSEDSAIPADLLELTKQYEEHFTAGIVRTIGHIDNLLVSVSVKVDPASRQKTIVRPDKDNSVSMVTRETTSKTSSSDGGGDGGEPGVTSNVGGVSVAGSGGAARSSMSDQESETEFENHVAETRTVERELAGTIQDVTATVNVPRSYFVEAFKAETGQDEPDAAALKDFIAAQLAAMKPKVLAAIGMTEAAGAGKVALGWYYDRPAVEPAMDEAEVEAAGMMTAVMGNAGSIGLGALAVVSLLAMLLMMRKAASSVTFASSDGGSGKGEGISYTVGDATVGDAGVADGYLQGVEVDEETLRTQKMVEQVGTMVRDNPETAAKLVKRWIAKKQG